MRSLRHAPPLFFSAAYLALIGWHLFSQASGEPFRSPFAYFWTWDMYPNYDTELVRRVLVAETVGGRALRLVPGPNDRFRWGMRGDACRIDLDRRDPLLQRAVDSALAQRSGGAATPGERIVRIALFERFRAARLEPAADSPLDPLLPGLDPEGREGWWRLVAAWDVTDGNRVAWTRRP